MKNTLKELTQLAEECIEFAISIKQPQGHTSLCNLISVYIHGGDYSVTFNSGSYKREAEINLYSNRVNMPIETSDDYLQDTLITCRASFSDFKASDLTERLNKNNSLAADKIERLKKELELLTNNISKNEDKAISSK